MRKNFITLIFSLIFGIAFVFFGRPEFFQNIPGFHCDWSGCVGLDIILFVIGIVLIPFIFGILGFVLSKENRLKQAFFSLGISLLVMLLSFWVVNLPIPVV